MLYRLVFRARTYARGSSKTKNASAGIAARDQVAVHALSGNITRIQFPRVRKDTGEAFEYEAGQYAFLCIPSISSLEWHPFTISSSPNEAMTLHSIFCWMDLTATCPSMLLLLEYTRTMFCSLVALV
ncbi:ferric reductase, putative [Phytophthora infestans T30-4]|uniref:Ferric reductase, putative n=1 Tax=Phytophthora infestans (strain T30-4) TaxID=403677 RepID=D0N0Y3_PHYIT|nr:ferric reductase, putative [Phytophthora infestans T30-4]EEY67296.1 ferric reductase, putative [Phytophthora infestans T30-4]|eukprot:XP_002905944.1 ferric reductase, putative [Phytophthora infestans T30-4]